MGGLILMAMLPAVSFANIPGGGTGTGANVTLTSTNTTATMSNGIVSILCTKAGATINQIAYTYNNGSGTTTTQLLNGGYDGGMLYWETGGFSTGTFTYSVVADPSTNGGGYAEIDLLSTSTSAGTLDIHFSMLRGSPGFYVTAIWGHRSVDAAMGMGETRSNIYAGSIFNWMSVDSTRNRLMNILGTTSLVVQGAPVETFLWTSGIYNGQYEDKYKYSADFGEQRVWGWSSVSSTISGATGKNVGLWDVTASPEYYNGGPMKRELMCHIGTTILNMFNGSHYGGGTDGNFAAGEVWTRVSGPYFVYCNNVSNTMTDPVQASSALYADAQAQATAEATAWPYSWFSNSNYTLAAGRGTVTGQIVINDSGNPNATAANLWVGVVQQPSTTDGVYDFQKWMKPYQFWVKSDANGNFTIPNVIAGSNYTLYAFGQGANGTFMSQAQTGGNPPLTYNLPATPFAVTVTGGLTTSLGTVTWTPTRVGPTVFELGYPDRTTAKFRHGDDYWVSDIGASASAPSPVWAKHLEYPFDFPSGPNFVVGTSRWSTDWNFVQPIVVSSAGADGDSNSTITFNLASTPASGSKASLYLALASDYEGAIIVTVNNTVLVSGSSITATPNSLPSTGYIPAYSGSADESDATIRQGLHGCYSDERITFPGSMLKAGTNTINLSIRQVGGSYFSDHAMYDYLRLELTGYVPPAPASVTAYAGNNSTLLNWPVTPGATSYNVLRSTTSGSGYTSVASGVTGPVCGSGPTNATYVDSTAVNGTTYYYVVESVNPTGTSANSTESTGVAPSSGITAAVPATPTGLTTAAGNGSVTLNWTTASGANTYTVQRSTQVNNGGGTAAEAFVTLGTATLSNTVTGTTYTDTTPTNGSIYSYAVTATNANGTSGSSTAAVATPVAPVPTATPANVTATAGALQETITWSAVAGATGYLLQQATTSGGPYTLVASATETTYTVTGLNANTTYYYVVSAVNSGGAGPNSAQASDTTPLAPPATLTALAGSGQITLSWSAVTGATSYVVQRSTVTGGPYTTVSGAGAVTGTTYTNIGLTNGTTYYYVVETTNGNGTGDISSEVNATPVAAASLTWTGVTSTAWDGATANWLKAGVASDYTDNSLVTFPDGATRGTVVLSLAVSPGSVAFTNATLAYAISGAAISGATSVVKSGAATVTLSSANAYTGGTTISSGIVSLNGTSASTAFTAAPGTGTVTLSGGEFLLAPTGTATQLQTSSSFANNFVLNGGILYGDDGQEHLTGAISVTGTTTLLRQWNNSTADQTKALLLDGVLSGSAALNLYGTGGSVSQGARTWIDNAANTYSGTVTVYASAALTGFTAPLGGNSLGLGSNTALQNATVDLEGTRTSGGTDATELYGVQFGDGVTAPVLGALQGNGNINLETFDTGTPAATLTVGGDNATTTFSGILSGTGGFTKAGSGTMTLSGANTYTGATTVSGGVLIITGNLTSSTSVSIASGATLNLASGGKLTTSGAITNNGTLVLGSGVTLSSTGAFTNNGTLDLRGDLSFTLPGNFVNHGVVLTAADTADTPTMPTWALIATAGLLFLTAERYLSRKRS
jgi:autotransporter-associated beta strand protein